MSQVADNAPAMTPRKRRPEDAEIDITPMIDIVFLLLAFFVVVSKMDPSTAVKMPRAKNGGSVPDATCVVLVVGESPNEGPRVWLGKAKKEGEHLIGASEDISEKIFEYVQAELRNNAEKTSVLIKAERKVKSRHVSLVKDAANRAIDSDNGQKIFVGIEEE